MSNKEKPIVTRADLDAVYQRYKEPISELSMIAMEKDCTIEISCYASGNISLLMREYCIDDKSFSKKKTFHEGYESYEETTLGK